MFRILLALLLFQAAGLAQAPAVEAVRSQLRPSLVVISKRVLIYAAEGDYKRASKAADYLNPLAIELGKRWKNRFVASSTLGEAIQGEDLLGVRDALRSLILADLHDLLTHLTDEIKAGESPPRTRLLMAQQDLKFLQAGLPKDKQGQRLRLALDKLMHALIQTVPHNAEYGKIGSEWTVQAQALSQKILSLMNSPTPGQGPAEVRS